MRTRSYGVAVGRVSNQSLPAVQLALVVSSLERNHLDSEAMGELGEALKLNKTLQSLECVGVELLWLPRTLDLPTAVRIPRPRECCGGGIVFTRLACNDIDDDGARALGDALVHNSALTTLRCVWHEIAAHGLATAVPLTRRFCFTCAYAALSTIVLALTGYPPWEIAWR